MNYDTMKSFLQIYQQMVTYISGLDTLMSDIFLEQ